MNDDQKLMLFFECENDQYAVACNDVLEVIPNIHTNGTVEYHGREVSVVDFTSIQTGRDSQPILSTRTIILKTGKDSITGLTAEKVLHTKRFSEESFINSTSMNGLSHQQLVTEDANIPVINPTEIASTAKEKSKAEPPA